MLEDEARYCSWGDTVHYNDPPRIFEKCDKQYLYDEQGKVYFDLQMQNSAANFGYRHHRYLEAINGQLERLPQIASEYLTKEKVALSKVIATSVKERWGRGGRVHFNVGGAQCIDDALKIVATATGSRQVFAFEGSYHGRTIGASSITSSFRYRAPYGRFGNRACFIPYPYCFRCPYQMKRGECDLHCVKMFARLFDSEYQGVINPKGGNCEFGAFFIEPVQGTGGYIIPPDGYFKELSKVLSEHDIILVSDEIQMGLYRTGKLWSIEHFGAQPDILVFGKSLTNGFNPMGGLWAKESLIAPNKFPPGSTHSTYGSNPLGCRLGMTTFEHITNNDYETVVHENGQYFLEGLREIERSHPEVGHVDGIGLALRIEICHADGITPNRELAKKIRDAAFEQDVETDIGPVRLVLNIGGYSKNVFTLAPCLDITRADIDRVVRMLNEYISIGKKS